jgi:hypothetical protein
VVQESQRGASQVQKKRKKSQPMDADGFTVVTKRSKIKKIPQKRLDLFTIESVEKILKHISFPPFHFIKKVPKIPIVCYGLGSLSNRSSIIQLQFLLLLQPHFPSISIYDPISTLQEIEFFKSKGFKWTDYNPKQNVFYYMIHCEHFMYHDILNQSTSFVLLGNRLSQYQFKSQVMEVDFGDYEIEFYGSCLHFVNMDPL